MVPPKAGRSGAGDPGVVKHWRPCHEHAEIWRVSLADCLRTVGRCADQETAVAVFDTAISSGRITRNGLLHVFAQETRRSRERVALARPGSDSGVESLLRQRLTARGHLVEQQVFLPGVGRVDFRVDGVLFVEVDGFLFHSDRVAFARDRKRDTAMTLRGEMRLRFSAREVIDQREDVVTTIEAVLDRTNKEEERALRWG